MKKAIFITVFVFALSFFASAKDEWHVFQQNGERNPASRIKPIEKPAVLWRTYVGIQGYLNNPVVAEGKVFVGSSGKKHNEKDEMDGVYALDEKTGAVAWFRPTELDACGVAYADGVVFSTGDDGVLRAFSAKDGEPLWTMKRPGELYCQPLPFKKLVVIGDSTGTIVAADQKTGKIKWATKAGDTNIRGGLSCDGKRIYAAFVDGKVASIKLDGKIDWQKKLTRPAFGGEGEDFLEIYGAPTIAGDKLVITFARDTYYDDPAVYLLDKKTGDITWKAAGPKDESFGNLRSSPVVWNGLILYGEPYSNSLIAIDFKKGTVAWQLNDLGAAMFPHYPSPAIAQDTLYLPRNDGGLYAVDLNKKEMKWMLYLGDKDKVGSELPKDIMPEGWEHCAWEPAVGKPIYATPALGKTGTIFIGTGEGYFFAIGKKK